MRIVILQWGDYATGCRRLRDGAPETFRDQRRSVDHIARLAPEHEVTTISLCGRVHRECLAPGLWSVGAPASAAWDRARLWPALDQPRPDVFICATPSRLAVAWAAARRIPTLPLFADTFTRGGLRDRINTWRLAREIRRLNAPCVANHSLSASRSLLLLGVPADRIVPWEHMRLDAAAAKSCAGRRAAVPAVLRGRPAIRSQGTGRPDRGHGPGLAERPG